MTCDITVWTQIGINHKTLNTSQDFFCIDLKLSTVVALIIKVHDIMSTPGSLHSKGKIRVFLLQEVLFPIVVHSVGVGEYGHYIAQAQESQTLEQQIRQFSFKEGRGLVMSMFLW